MIIVNGCVQEGTMTFQKGDSCYPPNHFDFDYSKIDDILRGINAILSCVCRGGTPTFPPFNPGTPTLPPTIKPVGGTSKDYPTKDTTIRNKPVREVVNDAYEGLYYPNGDIINIPGSWNIQNVRLLSKSGDDLIKYLPLKLDLYNKREGVILESIRNYRINDGVIELEYTIRNVNTDVVRILWGTKDTWRKWWDIYTNPTSDRNREVAITQVKGRIY